VDLLEDIDELVEGGRRAPGSDAERRAARHVERRLTELGRASESESISVWPNWPLAYGLLAALAVVASVLSVSLPLLGAALALVAALLTFLDAAFLVPTLRRALGRRASQNVVSWAEEERPGDVILVAHLDAPRAGLATRGRVRRFGGLRIVFAAQVAVLACCLLRLPGLEGTVLTLLQFIPTVVLILAAALLFDIALSGTKGGENDNASGVALALRLASEPLEHFNLHLLFTGGETAGAAGTRAFLRRHRLDRERTVFLNLDAVGAGHVRFTRREGPLLTTPSHVQLVALGETIAEDEEHGAFGARPLVSRSSSDAYAARSAGFPAMTITCRDDRDRLPAWIDEESLRRAEGFCLELLRRLDAEIGADLSRVELS
jgi:hypothetical protein